MFARRFMDANGHHNLQHPDPLASTLQQAQQVIAWFTGHTTPGAAQ